MKKNAGFTLIELMIVVAIIAIIAAIAIPNLLRSRMSANEAAAASSMRTISTSEVSYMTAAFSDANGDGEGDYGTLAQLSAPPVGQPFIDAVLGGGTKQGYTFAAVPVPGGVAPPTYTCNANPLTVGRTGVKAYFVDESGVIRFDPTGAPATVASLPMN